LGKPVGRHNLLVLCDTVDRAGGTESYLSRVLPELGGRSITVRIGARRVVEPNAFGSPAREFAWGADDEPANPAIAGAVAAEIAAWGPAAVLTSNVHDAAVLAAARTARRLIVRVHDHRLFCPQGDRQFPHFKGHCANPMSTPTCLVNAALRGCGPGANARTLRLLRSRQALRHGVLAADNVVVSSRFMAHLCELNGVATQRIATLPPPIGGGVARTAAVRPARDRVLFAGRLVRDKGLASLIRAVARLAPESRPLLAAAGEPTRESQPFPKLAARLGVDLTMLGKLAPRELEAAIDASSLVAMPSLWPEPFGLSGIEAHARGRPVVAYDVGGIREWMGRGGLLVPRGDEAALARAIDDVVNPARWPAFSAAALSQATAYGVAQHADALIELIDGAPARRDIPT
jgi:glycosyltransferase involved in cell wall biosynthesis